MKNELANKLHSIGFKLKKLNDWNMVECPFPWGHFKADDGESYIYPSLEQLISACGDSFLQLKKQHNPFTGERWWTVESNKEEQSTQAYSSADEKQPIKRNGETSEDAVAKLLVTLYKNESGN